MLVDISKLNAWSVTNSTYVAEIGYEAHSFTSSAIKDGCKDMSNTGKKEKMVAEMRDSTEKAFPENVKRKTDTTEKSSEICKHGKTSLTSSTADVTKQSSRSKPKGLNHKGVKKENPTQENAKCSNKERKAKNHKKGGKDERDTSNDRKMTKSRNKTSDCKEIKQVKTSKCCSSRPTSSHLDPDLFPWLAANQWINNYTIPKLKNKTSDSMVKSTEKRGKGQRRKGSRKRGHRRKSGYEADDSSDDEVEDYENVGDTQDSGSHTDSVHEVSGYHAVDNETFFTTNLCRKRKLVFESESEDEDTFSLIAEDLGLCKEDLVRRLSVRQRREVELVDRRLSSSDEEYIAPKKSRKHDKHWGQAMRILEYYRDSSRVSQAQKRKSSDIENEEIEERKRMRV